MRKAFSLTECLIVIIIGSLLLSIILPYLSQARETAKRTRCLSNLKDQTATLHIYVGNNNNLLPACPSLKAAWAEDVIRAKNGEIYKLIYDEFPLQVDGVFQKQSPFACPSDPLQYFPYLGFSYDYHVGLWMENPPSYRVDVSMAKRATNFYYNYVGLRVFEDIDEFHSSSRINMRSINASFFDGSASWTNQPSFKD